MKKIVTAAAVATVLAVIVDPAFANSSWVEVGNLANGFRFYVQKHNWQGRYRTYSQILVLSDGKQIQGIDVADCASWKWRPRDSTQWRLVLPGTMADTQMRYVCR
jgi:hypothetical protein